MSDPRAGKRSCSEFPRLAACPGSRRQIDATPPDQLAIEDPTVRDRGSRIHDHLSGSALATPVPQDEQAAIEACVLRERELVESLPISEEPEVIREVRIWHRSGEWSGQLDTVYVSGDVALVIDYKTGWGDVPPPASNLQLRGYALLAAQEWPALKMIYVALISPVKPTPPPAEYTTADVRAASLEIFRLLHRVERAEELTPGDHCQYCPARQGCPALRALAERAVSLEERAQSMPLAPEHYSVWLPALKRFIVTLEARGRRACEDGEGEALGLRLGKGRTQWTIDTAKAFDLFRDVVTPQEFTACCKLGKTALQDRVVKKWREADPAARVMDLRKRYDKELEAVAEKGTTRGSLEVIK